MFFLRPDDLAWRGSAAPPVDVPLEERSVRKETHQLLNRALFLAQQVDESESGSSAIILAGLFRYHPHRAVGKDPALQYVAVTEDAASAREYGRLAAVGVRLVGVTEFTVGNQLGHSQTAFRRDHTADAGAFAVAVTSHALIRAT